MPEFFDRDDEHGVRFTVDPKGILCGHKKLKNLVSPPISVGKNIRLIIKFEKLRNFNEQEKQFWFGKAILEKLPSRNVVNIENINFFKSDEQVFEIEHESEFTSSEGDAVYKVGNRHSIHLSFYSKDAFPLYTANIRSKEWKNYGRIMGVFWAIIGTVIGGVILAKVMLGLGLK